MFNAGPAGGAVGGVVSLIADAFGIADPEPKPDQIMQALKADPEAAIKLQEIQMNHKTRLEEIALENDKAVIQDIQNARTASIERMKITGKVDFNQYILAWLVVVGFFALCITLAFAKVEDNQAVLILFGALGAGFTQVMNYNFGSSRGSREKTSMLGLAQKRE